MKLKLIAFVGGVMFILLALLTPLFHDYIMQIKPAWLSNDAMYGMSFAFFFAFIIAAVACFAHLSDSDNGW